MGILLKLENHHKHSTLGLHFLIHCTCFLLQILTWIIAAFLIAINGYLLLDFFSSSVHGLLLGSIVCAGLAVYVAFVIYLILYSTSVSARLRKSLSRGN